MFRLTLSFCVALLFLSGCATTDKPMKKKFSHHIKTPGRLPASSAEDVARAYMKVAETMADYRAANGACNGDGEVYHTDIVQAVRLAFEKDPKAVSRYPASTNLEAEGTKSLSYNLMRDGKRFGFGFGNDSAKGDRIEFLLKGTKFEGPGMGAYGHFLELQFGDDGSVKIRQKSVDFNTGDPTWHDFVGTYSVGDFDHDLNAYPIKFNIPNIPQGLPPEVAKKAAEARDTEYVLRQFCASGDCYVTIVRKKVAEKNWETTWQDAIVFDQVTSECDA